MPPRFIADTSAIARMRLPAVRARLAPLLRAGDVATCGIVELEVLWSARSADEIRSTRSQRKAFPLVPMEQSDFERAAELVEELATRGKHRSVGLPDLLIAAAAERAGLTLLHYDSDFEAIASVTGQRTEWVVPRGSVP